MKGNTEWKKRITADLKDSTEEVRGCFKRAEFVGKWFAGSGSAATVMAILGMPMSIQLLEYPAFHSRDFYSPYSA